MRVEQENPRERRELKGREVGERDQGSFCYEPTEKKMWEPIDEDIPPPRHTRAFYMLRWRRRYLFSFVNHLLLSPSSFIPPPPHPIPFLFPTR